MTKTSYLNQLGPSPFDLIRVDFDWGLWVMGCVSPRTNLVDGKTYGLSQVMGYLKYGLWQVRLYTVYIKPGANQLALTVFRDQTYCQLQ